MTILTSAAWTGCDAAESETTLAPTEQRQQLGGEGFVPRADGVLIILAATEDEVIDTALQEAVDEGRITKEQADEVKGWWQQRPKILSPDVFLRQMREGDTTRSE